MSLLVVGLTHRTAPIDLLERVALDAEGARALARSVIASGAAAEAVVLATCNRVELWAEVGAFHAGVHDLAAALAAQSGVPLAALCDHLAFAYGERAVERLFAVASGLDSMAVGESQVLGQVRAALRRGQEDGTAGRVLDPLLQRALRVGKRVHSETGLDRAGRSLVEAALEGAGAVGGLVGASALVVGAGSMSALAATTLHRLGAGRITVANRTPARAARLAEAVGGGWVALDDADGLRAALAGADVVVSCTGAVGHVLDAPQVAAARGDRAAASPGGAARPQLVVDLALPRDVDPAVAGLEGVELVGLAELRERLTAAPEAADPDGLVGSLRAARAVVQAEVHAHLAEQRAASVAPTVTALRTLARELVDAEVARLRGRLGEQADPRAVAEAELAVHRVVEKLLHTPTVRVKALAAGGDDGAAYAAALRELFALGGEAPAAAGPLAGGPVGDLAAGGPTAGAAGSGSVADVLRAEAERARAAGVERAGAVAGPAAAGEAR